MIKSVTLILLLILMSNMIYGDNRCISKSLNITIDDDYDRNVAPAHNLSISIGFANLIASTISSKEETVIFHMYIYTSWHDKRFLVKDLNKTNCSNVWEPLDYEKLNLIWKPHLEIYNIDHIKTFHLVKKFSGLWINECGYVRHSSKIKIRINCRMEFADFPFDSQLCLFQIADYTNDISRIVLIDDLWDMADNKLTLIESKIQQIVYVSALNDDERRIQYNQGNLVAEFSVAGFRCYIRRNMQHYFVSYYIPSGLFVIASWVSFFVPPQAIPGRLGLLVTILLVLISIFTSVSSTLPSSRTITLLETWMLICVIFVVEVLIEYTIVLYLIYNIGSIRDALPNRKIGPRKESNFFKQQKERVEREIPQLAKTTFGWIVDSLSASVHVMDLRAFYANILGFTIMNVIYWSYVTTTNDSIMDKLSK